MNYVLDGLRTEFPSFFGALARVRFPPVRREPPFWAFLAAQGALLLVAGVLHLILLATPRSLTDPVIRWPFGATLNTMVTLAASIVAGAVLIRAGGARAIPFYVAFALLGVLASLPSLQVFCDRSGADVVCNATVFYVAAGRTPEWLGALVGSVAAMRLGRAAQDGANRMLRGAGAFGVAQFALIVPIVYATYGLGGDQQLQTALFLIAYSLAGVIAGLVLRDARFAAALLVALVVVAPTLGLSLPLLRNGQLDEPIEITFTRFGGLLAPALAGACLIGAWVLARRRLRS